MARDLPLVLIKGAGDLASGVALRLWRSGFPVAMTEIERPTVVRRTVAFAEAIFAGACTVEGITARRCTPEQAAAVFAAGVIPVMVDPAAASLAVLRPYALVDAIIAKRNTGTRLADAPLVIGLGPGFTAGVECHAVIETNRGHFLGRVLWQGSAEPDTGLPGELPGFGRHVTRVLRAPIAGHVDPQGMIGQHFHSGAVIAWVRSDDGEHAAAPVTAPFDGVLRGLVHPSVPVTAGMKIGDLDPRAEPLHCVTVSDKSLAIGGGVLEAVMTGLMTAMSSRQPADANLPATN